MRRFLTPFICYETPDLSGGGGGAGTAVAPGTTPQQGQGQPQQGDGFWNLFPNVPEEHRPLLEPHIRAMQGETTRMQQQLAPFKPFMDAGMSPEAASGLIRLSQSFERDPLATWLDMGRQLQEAQMANGRFVVDPELDLEHLAAIARGEDLEQGQQPPPVDGTQSVAGGQQSPELASALQTIQRLENRLEQLEGGIQQERTTRQQTQADRAHASRLGQMREALVKSGWPEDLLTDDYLNSAVITSRGDYQAATTNLINQRTGLLKGLVPTNQERQPSDGDPPAPDRSQDRARNGRDPWAGARKNAESRLRRNNAAANRE